MILIIVSFLGGLSGNIVDIFNVVFEVE